MCTVTVVELEGRSRTRRHLACLFLTVKVGSGRVARTARQLCGRDGPTRVSGCEEGRATPTPMTLWHDATVARE